jgi:hypothetical protein
LHIIDGVSRETAPDPLAMAIKRNEATGLSANSLLIRRDGYESAIEDTATPIHDAAGDGGRCCHRVPRRECCARNVTPNVISGPTRLSDRAAQSNVAQ